MCGVNDRYSERSFAGHWIESPQEINQNFEFAFVRAEGRVLSAIRKAGQIKIHGIYHVEIEPQTKRQSST